MNMKFSAKIAAAALLLTSFQGFADVVTGKLEFVKKPPFAGLLYVEGSGGSDKKPLIDQKDKQFTTKIAVGSPNNTMMFKNSDTFDHNIYANDGKQKVKFDVGLMTPNNQTQITINWPEETLVRIGCKIHPKMRSYIANVNSDHFHAFEFEKKVKSYDIKIDSVPGDKNKLVLMMPKYDKLVVDLKKGESKTVEVKRKGKVSATLTLNRS